MNNSNSNSNNNQHTSSVDTSNPITPLPDSPVLSPTRRKNTNTLSWSSTSSSFSTNSVSTLSSTATPMTAITNSTLPLVMMRSSSRTLPLLISDDDEDDDEIEHTDDDDLIDTTMLLERNDTHWHQQTNDEEEDDQQTQQQKLHQQRWYRRVTKSLSYACSHGDAYLVKRILEDERLRPFLNVDGSDDKQMGTTPLIYASCFGYASIVQLLLDAGAKVDGQDKIGWSPLMWATTNNHKTIVEILLAHGASWKNQTSKGRTVLDFVDYNNQELVHSLTPDERDDDKNDQQHQDFYNLMNSNKRRQGSISTLKRNLDADTSTFYNTKLNDNDNDNGAVSEIEPLQQQEQQQHTSLESVYAEDDEELDDLVSCEASMESLHHFVWNRCLPDQMFVFAEDDIDHILQITITGLHLPMKTRQEIWVPSNVLFLCSRYAHYYSGRELLTGILGGAISLIAAVLHKNKGDIHTTAFWMANLSQLLYYLKKDTGLVVATAEQQLEISELVSETYVLLVTDSEKRIEKILEASMMDHDLIGADPVDFADDWQRFFRRRGSSRRPSSMASLTTTSSNYSNMEAAPSITRRAQELYQDDQHQPPQQQQRQNSMDQITTQPPTSPINSLSSFMSSTSPTSPSYTTLSPHSVTSLLSSILYVLQSYEVHPAIIVQAIAQFFHFMSCEIFNRILSNKKLLCRSKALQIRMNLSIVEDWVREQQPYLPVHLTTYFDPLIQLLQLLQCVSQLNELATFVGTTTGFELLNPLQIRRCVLNYRYEVDEPRLPDEVERYTVQLAQDAVNNSSSSINVGGNSISRNNSRRKRSGAPMERSTSRCSISKVRTAGQGSAMDNSTASSRRESHVSSRPTSVSSIGSLIMARWTSSSAALPDQKKVNDEEEECQRGRWDDDDLDDDEPFAESDNDDDDGGRDWIAEKRDSKYMLPFSLPTSTTMIHYASYQQQQQQQVGPLRLELHHPSLDDDWMAPSTMNTNNNHKLHDLMMATDSLYEEMRQKKGATERERLAKERTVIPTIPQDWMDRLDRRQETHRSASKKGDGDHDAMDGYLSHGARRAMEVY